MLRGKNKLGFNLTAPSDLREIYRACVARGEKLPMSFTVAAHPLDTMSAVSRNIGDEIDALATLRGEPLPVVKCVTNDIRVPADSEIVLEGYADERGYSENEGPYGEYMGYYGPMHLDPVFHVTAITRRRDVLYQTYKHGIGKNLGECDGAATICLQSELRALGLLRRAKLDPVEAYVARAAGLGCNLRVSLRKHGADDARLAIKTILTEMPTVKHVFITDEDIDVRSTDEFEWALATRFQAARDLVVMNDMHMLPMDPSPDIPGNGSKAGFDLTFSYPRSNSVTARVAGPARIEGPARYQTVEEALRTGPVHFAKLMSAVGSEDGREIVLEIEKLRDRGLIDRNGDGEYYLRK
jgi:UbiD family decarboxylase